MRVPANNSPGWHRPPAPAVAVTFVVFALGVIGLAANLDSLRASWGLRGVAALLGLLALGSAYWVRRTSRPSRTRQLFVTLFVVLALVLVATATLAPGKNAVPRYDARLNTKADATRFVQWLYDHYETEIYLKVEITPGVMTANGDPQAMSRPRRIAVRSDVCGSATLGSGQLETYECVDSDVVLGVFPFRDQPDSVDLWWTGGGVGAWTLRGTFIPNAAQGPNQGTWYIGLEERLTDVPPR